jgi:hypothetical protein
MLVLDLSCANWSARVEMLLVLPVLLLLCTSTATATVTDTVLLPVQTGLSSK